jgi:putative transposase
VYHVINRGNGQATVFHKDADYRAFLDLLAAAKTKFPVKLFAFCLMPNHFHLVLRPETAPALSAMMQWWLTSHVRRYHRHYQSSGHIWQGRFKSFLIQEDGHLLTVIRYVLLNPVRARLVDSAEQWRWSNIWKPEFLDPWPLPAPLDWPGWLAAPLSEPDLTALRSSVNRQAPFGEPDWQTRMAVTLGLQSTLRPRGRPRKSQEK